MPHLGAPGEATCFASSHITSFCISSPVSFLMSEHLPLDLGPVVNQGDFISRSLASAKTHFQTRLRSDVGVDINLRGGHYSIHCRWALLLRGLTGRKGEAGRSNWPASRTQEMAAPSFQPLPLWPGMITDLLSEEQGDLM